MKKLITLLASMALVASGLSVVPAAAAADGGDVKFFLGSAGCSAEDFLTITDADDEIECFYTAAGARADIGEAVGNTPVSSDRETSTRRWDTLDGVPLTLDATKPITGTIFTSGGSCVISGGCSPAGASAGEVILELAVVGTSGGQEIELGTQTDTFNVVPGSPHATEVSIQPDAGVSGKVFEVLELHTWIHGKSVGHGVVKTTGDYSSFISVPTAAAGAKKTPPGKNDPPGKKKGCGKGKGKKRGCEGKGKKSPKPGKPSAQCAAYAPGEMGAEAETTVLTDEATEEKPFEMAVPLGPATGTYGSDRTTRMKHNVQVDTKNKDAGLFIRLETPALEDPDLYAYWPSGSQAAMAAGFNPLLAAGPLPGVHPIMTGLNGEGSGGHSEFTAEQIDGLLTADCQGWTLDLVNWAGRGGEYTLKMWLGPVENEPAEEK